MIHCFIQLKVITIRILEVYRYNIQMENQFGLVVKATGYKIEDNEL